MRSLQSFALLGGMLFAGLVTTSVACDKEKSNAEKHAEEIAKSASAQKSAAVADAAPDPAELKYKERKRSLEKTVTDMKADEAHVMAKDPSATPGILRHYFESGDDGDKLAKELELKRKKDGEGGYTIKQAKIADTRLKDNFEEAEIDVTEEDVQKGLSACLMVTQVWKWKDEKWLFKQQLTVKKVDCPQ